jgi:hypothetical protein
MLPPDSTTRGGAMIDLGDGLLKFTATVGGENGALPAPREFAIDAVEWSDWWADESKRLNGDQRATRDAFLARLRERLHAGFTPALGLKVMGLLRGGLEDAKKKPDGSSH